MSSMENLPTTGKVKVTKASKELQLKAGIGEIDPARIQKAEKVIEVSTQDFDPVVAPILTRLEQGIAAAKTGLNRIENPETGEHRTFAEITTAMAQMIAGIIQPVMDLKAMAKMYRYDLVSALANIMLDFLEKLKDMDRDAIEIVEAHHKTITLLIAKKVMGEAGTTGALLKTELEDACQRYYARKNRMTTTQQ
jgi:hypothetical protein